MVPQEIVAVAGAESGPAFGSDRETQTATPRAAGTRLGRRVQLMEPSRPGAYSGIAAAGSWREMR